MLVLGRKGGEGVTITAPNGDEIHVVLLKPSVRRTSNGVEMSTIGRLGIECPREYEIVRDELLTEGV